MGGPRTRGALVRCAAHQHQHPGYFGQEERVQRALAHDGFDRAKLRGATGGNGWTGGPTVERPARRGWKPVRAAALLRRPVSAPRARRRTCTCSPIKVRKIPHETPRPCGLLISSSQQNSYTEAGCKWQFDARLGMMPVMVVSAKPTRASHSPRREERYLAHRQGGGTAR
eukprot:scaffold8096_cov112-Isochrysis_galbana.AAC.2